MMCFSPQRRAIFKHQNLQKWSKHVMFCAFSLLNVPFATGACIFSTSELTKVLRNCRVLYIFTSKCAFRHRVVQFCNIWTYKSGPNTSCFVHFHFKMCFSPQLCTIFRHVNFKKCSEDNSFLTFWLHDVLFATASYNFATSELTKVVQTRHVLYIFTSKCAFRHSFVQFFDMWTSKSAPRTTVF